MFKITEYWGNEALIDLSRIRFIILNREYDSNYEISMGGDDRFFVTKDEMRRVAAAWKKACPNVVGVKFDERIPMFLDLDATRCFFRGSSGWWLLGHMEAKIKEEQLTKYKTMLPSWFFTLFNGEIVNLKLIGYISKVGDDWRISEWVVDLSDSDVIHITTPANGFVELVDAFNRSCFVNLSQLHHISQIGEGNYQAIFANRGQLFLDEEQKDHLLSLWRASGVLVVELQQENAEEQEKHKALFAGLDSICSFEPYIEGWHVYVDGLSYAIATIANMKAIRPLLPPSFVLLSNGAIVNANQVKFAYKLEVDEDEEMDNWKDGEWGFGCYVSVPESELQAILALINR